MFFPPPPPPPLPPPFPPPPLPGGPPLPGAPPAAAIVRVPAALVRKSATAGTCSSVRFAPFSFMRATVVVHPALSAVLFFTRSSEWHEAQTVFTRFAATASGSLEVGAAPSGAWARITRATPRRNAPTFKKSLCIEVIISNWRSLKKRGQDLYFVFSRPPTPARTPLSSRRFGPSKFAQRHYNYKQTRSN